MCEDKVELGVKENDETVSLLSETPDTTRRRNLSIQFLESVATFQHPCGYPATVGCYDQMDTFNRSDIKTYQSRSNVRFLSRCFQLVDPKRKFSKICTEATPGVLANDEGTCQIGYKHQSPKRKESEHVFPGTRWPNRGKYGPVWTHLYALGPSLLNWNALDNKSRYVGLRATAIRSAGAW